MSEILTIQDKNKITSIIHFDNLLFKTSNNQK